MLGPRLVDVAGHRPTGDVVAGVGDVALEALVGAVAVQRVMLAGATHVHRPVGVLSLELPQGGGHVDGVTESAIVVNE